MMQFRIEIPGTFKRVPENSGAALSLADLLPRVAGTAQRNFDGWTARMARDYGLDLMLEPTLKELIGATVRTESGDAPYLSRAKGLLRRDQRLIQSEAELTGAFQYRFHSHAPVIPAEGLLLSAADPAIPARWPITGEVDGLFPLLLEDGICPQFPELDVSLLWEQAQLRRQTLSHEAYLEALNALEPGQDVLAFPLGHSATLLVQRDDTPGVIQAAWGLVAADSPANFKMALQVARRSSGWNHGCESWLAERARRCRRPDWLEAMGRDALKALEVQDHPLRARAFQPILAQGDAERHLRDIIVGAREFLFVASYVIEDVALATLIARQAEKMPGRVWVLCNLKETFVDNLPALLGEAEPSGPLPEVDRRKLDCLRILLASPALVRHAETHLKAYASEQRGFLGSPNLTRMSLRRNWESGVMVDDAKHLHSLLSALKHFWIAAQGRIAWAEVGEGLVIDELKSKASKPEAMPAPFLTPNQYQVRLQEDLAQAKEEVLALSHSVPDDSPLLKAGSTRLRRKIGVDSQKCGSHPALRPIPLCHAKIVIIDRKVAYLGGVNAPGTKPGRLLDLMVRLEDPVIIAQLAGDIAWLF